MHQDGAGNSSLPRRFVRGIRVRPNGPGMFGQRDVIRGRRGEYLSHYSHALEYG